jgi:hypothetical protein
MVRHSISYNALGAACSNSHFFEASCVVFTTFCSAAAQLTHGTQQMYCALYMRVATYVMHVAITCWYTSCYPASLIVTM